MDARHHPSSLFPIVSLKKTYAPSELPTEIDQFYQQGLNELKKHGLENHEARVALVLDLSSSMQYPNFFFGDATHPNQIQEVINKALALAFLFDDNQQIEVFPFGDQVYGDRRADPASFQPFVLDRTNFNRATDIIREQYGFLNATNYAAPVKKLRDYYFKQSGPQSVAEPCADAPLFAIFITDGEPNQMKNEAINQFRYASHQAIFFKFLALKGEQQDAHFPFLQRIDDHPVKANPLDRSLEKFFIDNSDLVILNQPNELTMEKLIYEYRPWLIEAYEKKILLNHPGVMLRTKNSEGRITATPEFKQGDVKKKHTFFGSFKNLFQTRDDKQVLLNSSTRHHC